MNCQNATAFFQNILARLAVKQQERCIEMHLKTEPMKYSSVNLGWKMANSHTRSEMQDNSLTIEAMLELRKLLAQKKPTLYYATEDVIERGTFYVIEETDWTCKAIACHPDDLEKLKSQAPHIQFVHLKDRPREDIEKQLQKATRRCINGMVRRGEWIYSEAFLRKA